VTDIEIHRDYVRNVIQLKLWRVKWLAREEGMPFEEAIQKRVGLYWKTTLASDWKSGPVPDGDWGSVLVDLVRICEAHRVDASSEALESEGLNLLWPWVEPRLESDLESDAEWVYRSGNCFRYQFDPSYHSTEGEDYLTLHFRNAFRPDSPFRRLDDLAGMLTTALEKAVAERPDVKMAQMGSWVNSVPAFASIFPAPWTDNAVHGGPAGHLGWWGQFMDRRGGFHKKNADCFRSTGEFPYTHLLSQCGISDLQRHLSEAPWHALDGADRD
jgi:hypothetical protein